MMTLTHRMNNMMTGGWRRRYVIVVPMLLLPIIGGVVGSMGKQKYSSHTSMLIQETAKQNPFLEDFALSPNLKERMAGLKILLHSRYILTQVAEDREMIYKKTPEKKRDYIVSKLSSNLGIELAGTDLIRLTYKSDKPEGMKEVLESVTRFFIEELLAPERSSVSKSAEFLRRQMTKYEVELEIAEKKLAEYKGLNADSLPELHSAAIGRLTGLRQTLLDREAELAGANQGMKNLLKRLAGTNPIVGKIEEQLVKYRSQLVLLRARYTEEHSSVRALVRKIERLEEDRQEVIKKKYDVDADRLWDLASSATSEESRESSPLLISQLETLQAEKSRQEQLQGQVVRLKSMITVLEKETGQYGDKERNLVELQRDLIVKRRLYEDLLRRHEMAKVTRELGRFEQDGRIKIIDRAFKPSRSLNPPAIAFVIGGVIGGLFLGLGIAVILELSDSSIRRRDQLIEITGVPVLTRLPAIDSIRKYRI